MDAIYKIDESGLPIAHKGLVAPTKVMDWVSDNWDQAGEGIWETRGRQDFTYGRLQCWVALDRAIKMAQRNGRPADTAKWTARRDRLYNQAMSRGWNDKVKAFTQPYKTDVLDSSLLFMPIEKSIADALTIRRRVFGAFELAETAADPEHRRRWLTFALVGAGPTGVELAGQIRELATKTLRAECRNIEPEDARVLLFDGGSAPLAVFGDELSRRAADELTALGVEFHMGSIVTSVDHNGLVARDHDGNETRYHAGTVLWTAGVEAPPFAEALANATGAERDRAGRIGVQDDLTIKGYPEISVVGDMMSLRKLPGVAEVAMQSGLYAGRRVKRELAGKPAGRPFRYHDLGSAAYISRGRAVVSAGPIKLSGFAGWIVWLFIHIMFLTGFRNRIGALLTWWVAFVRDVRRERAFTTRQVGHMEDVYEPVPAAGPTATPTPPAQRSVPERPAAHRRGS
jgi:NADH:ubiquinone reductase (H+-translocating)